jgi:hypothetical protein
VATVAAIVERVERRVIDLPSHVQAETETLVEKAYREIQRAHNFDVMERRLGLSTTSGDPSLGTLDEASASLFKEFDPEQKPFWTDDSGETSFLEIAFSEAQVRAMFNQDASLGVGRPRVLLWRHQAGAEDHPGDIELKVYPVPDGLAQTSDGEYSIQVPYYRYLTFPSTSDWFTNNAEWFIIFAATAEAFLLNQDPQQAAIWQAKADKELREVIRVDKRLKVSPVSVLVPYRGATEPKLRF